VQAQPLDIVTRTCASRLVVTTRRVPVMRSGVAGTLAPATTAMNAHCSGRGRLLLTSWHCRAAARRTGPAGNQGVTGHPGRAGQAAGQPACFPGAGAD
jgi:hypothetical protein